MIGSYSDDEYDVLLEASDDYVPLSSIVWNFRGEPDDVVREKTLRIVSVLLRSGALCVGDLRLDGFYEWPGTWEESIARINESWVDLGRPPGLKQNFAWFAATDAGKAWVDAEYKRRASE